MRCRMIKSQANIATRHDILVYFFQANVVGNVATSSPMASTNRQISERRPQIRNNPLRIIETKPASSHDNFFHETPLAHTFAYDATSAASTFGYRPSLRLNGEDIHPQGWPWR